MTQQNNHKKKGAWNMQTEDKILILIIIAFIAITTLATLTTKQPTPQQICNAEQKHTTINLHCNNK